MTLQNTSTLDFVRLFARAVRDLVQGSTGKPIHVSKTALKTSGIQISGDLGAFVTFKGDYTGIMILNFEGDAAMEIVTDSLLLLGLPEEEIPRHYSSDEVRNNIGELTNQAVGRCRTMVQDKYDLSAKANIPAVVPITVPVALTMVSKEPTEMECVRVAFTTERRNRFHMELALEPIYGRALDIP